VKPEIEQHLARADELLRLGRQILGLGYPADVVSRCYYAMFHGATAVLLELGVERKSHHALWAAFGQLVAKPGLMDARFHHTGIRLMRLRSRSDYLPEPDILRKEAEESVQAASEFLIACRTFLEKRETGPSP